MEEKDKIAEEQSEQNKTQNQKLPYAMLFVLALLIVAVLGLIKNSINDFTEKMQAEKNKSPVKIHSFSNTSKKTSVNKNNTEKRIDRIRKDTSKQITIGIRPLECYNGKTKEEMYNLRTEYVQSSLFYSLDYKPSEEVFGRIVDGKPWWGLKPLVCSNGDEDTTVGVSAVSRFINNPDLLVQTYFPFNLQYSDEVKEFCNGEFAKNIPVELTYDPVENLITAKYTMSPLVYKYKVNYYGIKNINYPLILSGLNARDFGYDYMKIVDLYNIKMLHDENASKKVYKFKDYIHVGSSCRHKDGCNNMSPRQPELEFNIKSLPAEMEIKLWKKEPFISDLTADINFKIKFEQQ